jgi:hypothetical protein
MGDFEKWRSKPNRSTEHTRMNRVTNPEPRTANSESQALGALSGSGRWMGGPRKNERWAISKNGDQSQIVRPNVLD